MTSFIRVQRICSHCGAEFTAQKTTTKYCSEDCAKRAYKNRKRDEKIAQSNEQTKQKKTDQKIRLDDRDFFSVPQVASLLGCSRQNIYNLINCGHLRAINLLIRKTLISRVDLQAFIDSRATCAPKKVYSPDECYTVGEAQRLFGVQAKSLYEIIKRYDIEKTQLGRNVYIPKEQIDKIFN